MQLILPLLLAFFLFFAGPAAAAQPGPVVVSIKPLHSLVAGVMGDTGKPVLLVGGMKSPHGYQLTPSQATQIQNAGIVFYIGPELETFLVKPLKAAPESVLQDALIYSPGVKTLKPRRGGLWDADEDDSESASDPHVWLDIANAKAMVDEIEQQLSLTFPQNESRYKINAVMLKARLGLLDQQMKTKLGAFKNRPFIVFHDAFQYFEKDYGLKDSGAITLEPEQEPGAKRISEIRARIKTARVSCVFSEPEFNSRLVKTVTEGTEAKTGVIDEQGARLAEGPDLYFELMNGIADAFRDCLR